MKSLIVIPARMESKRLPGKPLLDVGGKSLLERTYNRAAESHPSHTLVATSDSRVIAHCKGIGLNWMDTGEHPTGTHRCAEAAAKLTSQYDVVVNWQVDEPEVKSVDVERLIRLAAKRRIGTLIAHLNTKDRRNSNITKATIEAIVVDAHQYIRCLWFGRHHTVSHWGHVGIYAFDWEALMEIGRLPPTEVSIKASLEQLTWLENAWGIRAVETDEMPLSINTPEDLKRFEEIVDAKVD